MSGPEEKYKRQSGGEKEPLKTIHHNWVTSQSLQRVSDWRKRFLHSVFFLLQTFSWKCIKLF